VDRAAELLHLLASQGAQRLVDLDGQVAMPRRALQRLLASLEHAGLVARDPETRRYELGMGLAVLGAIAGERMDLARLAPPHVRRVRDQTGQTGFLLFRREEVAVCAHLEVPTDGPALVLPLGRTVPLWRGAVRIVLAYLPADEVARLVPADEADVVRERLAVARERGWDVGRAEVLPGAIAVAAPVFDPFGAPVACVGALGYDGHLPVDWCVQQVQEAAAALTAALGGRPPRAASA
jgi:DNA-binding IclR family transcriptional regulator